ncbi:MAG TPA: hypothetical protein VFT80_12910 [Actinomycetota bacterium]|nr:hypothetical protein [Actinomycetota bacterium]
MKLLRTTMMALAALIVAGTVASAATSFDEVPDPEPTVSPSPSVEPTVSPSPEPEPVLEPVLEDEEGEESVEGKTADFSACEGLTGLENAICRHEALLEVKPDHQGLMNALDHLYANQEKQAEKWAEKHGEDLGTTEGETSSCPGKSCEPHGNGNGNGHGNGR